MPSQTMDHFFHQLLGHSSPTAVSPTPSPRSSSSIFTVTSSAMEQKMLVHPMLNKRFRDPGITGFVLTGVPSALTGSPVSLSTRYTWICAGINAESMECNSDTVFVTSSMTTSGRVTPVPSFSCSGRPVNGQMTCGSPIWTATDS
jgi:hypothetical protein